MHRIGLALSHSAHVRNFLPAVYLCYNVTGEVQSSKGEGLITARMKTDTDVETIVTLRIRE